MFIHSFTSFIHSFLLLLGSFVFNSFIYSFIQSLMRSFIHYSIRFIHSFIQLFIHSSARFIHSFIQASVWFFILFIHRPVWQEDNQTRLSVPPGANRSMRPPGMPLKFRSTGCRPGLQAQKDQTVKCRPPKAKNSFWTFECSPASVPSGICAGAAGMSLPVPKLSSIFDTNHKTAAPFPWSSPTSSKLRWY